MFFYKLLSINSKAFLSVYLDGPEGNSIFALQIRLNVLNELLF